MLVMRELNGEDTHRLEDGLKEYDFKCTNSNLNKKISYGYFEDNKLIAGIIGKIEGFKVLYIETLYVEEGYRKHGLGRQLISLIEQRAKFEGASTIRLDTFSWQGRDFYNSIGYELIASYELELGYSEFFFVKRLWKNLKIVFNFISTLNKVLYEKLRQVKNSIFRIN